MRPARMSACKVGVVATDLRSRLLAVRQKKQVVDRDDLRGVSRRNQQRVRRVNDVEPAGAGETPIIAIAPAIGNAVVNATGMRLRSMPMRLA